MLKMTWQEFKDESQDGHPVMLRALWEDAEVVVKNPQRPPPPQCTQVIFCGRVPLAPT